MGVKQLDLAALLLAVLSLQGLVAAKHGHGFQYGVMMDAGSTGTRCYVYRWPARTSPQMPNVEVLMDEVTQQDLSKKVNPGISTFSGREEQIDAYLQPLLSFAKQHIPEHMVAETPLCLFATAGMRLLSESDQDAILSAVISTFSASGFQFSPANAAVITGSTEALYGWVSVNYLYGRLDTMNTVGALDLGGASTQIAFASSSQKASQPASTSSRSVFTETTVTFSGIRHRVYTVSFLGYGGNAFADQVQSTLCQKKDSTSGNATVEDPCLLQGYEASGGAGACAATFAGTSDSAGCEAVSRTVIAKPSSCSCPENIKCTCTVEGEKQPVLDPAMEFIAMSNFYWTTSFLGLSEDASPSDIKAKAEEFCELTWEEAVDAYPDNEYLHSYCGNGVLVAELLSTYGFTDQSALRFEKDVNGKEVSWALGAMLVKANLLPLTFNDEDWIEEPTSVVLVTMLALLLAALALVAGIMFVKKRGSQRHGHRRYSILREEEEEDVELPTAYAEP